MEKDFGFGFNMHLLSSSLNLSGCLDQPARRYPHAVEDSTLRNLPLIPDQDFQQSKTREASRLQQRSPLRGTLPSEKRFLVFDQSGGQTTLLYTSGVPTRVRFEPFRVPDYPTTCNLSKEELKNSYCPLRPSLNSENSEDFSRENITEDEMHEDTEELDALLCSDDDDDSSKDDETSTGHSPSTMTGNGRPEQVDETGEEVDSFSVPPKRAKVLDGPSNRYAASSELERDAESSRGSCSNQHKVELRPWPGCKRSRRDTIHETVSILQSIIPEANGKDAVVVIDQAIHYLRSLKVKAKTLGLDAI